MDKTIKLPDSSHPSDVVNSIISESLMEPLHDFFRNPGKNLRAQIVELGFLLAHEREDEASLKDARSKLEIAISIVECIHSGSLIVDDIQDESLVRRNSPTLHLKYGIPKALNAGNWLYFWALSQMRLLELTPELHADLMDECLKLMIQGHLGQAIDVGTKIDQVPQEKVKEVCMASLELKTGALFSLGLRMGSSLVNPKSAKSLKLERLGYQLGVALQVMDDAGNFLMPFTPNQSKRREDLRLRRASWVWALASDSSKESYANFLDCVSQLPDERAIDRWCERHDFSRKVLEGSRHFLNQTVEALSAEWEQTHPLAFVIIKDIGKKLERAYV